MVDKNTCNDAKMKIREIDFDPPPPQQQQQQHQHQWAYYDIRQFNNSIDSGQADVNNNNNKYSDEEVSSSTSSSSHEENELDVSITWSNAPGIEDSPKSYYSTGGHSYNNGDDTIIHMEKLDIQEKRNYGIKKNTTATTVYDDEDENNSVFLSWPELPASPQQQQQRQKPLGEKGTGDDDEGIILSEQPQSWFKWRRRPSSDSDVFIHSQPANYSTSTRDDNATASSATNNNADATNNATAGAEDNNYDANDDRIRKSDNEAFLVPQNQQWWQFGRRRRRRSTIDTFDNGANRSPTESNTSGVRRWRSIESYNSGEEEKEEEDMLNKSGDSNNFICDNTNANDGNSFSNNNNNNSPEKMLHRKNSDESNRSVTSSSADVEIKLTRKPNRRKSLDSNKSFTSSVDVEVNEWLFPRRGRCQRNNWNNSTRSLWGAVEPSSSFIVPSSNPPQSQGGGDGGVEVIVDKLKKSFVDLSPIERALLNDLASTKNTNRWRNRSSIPSADDTQNFGVITPLGGSTPILFQGDEGELEEVSPEEANRSSPNRCGNAQQGVPEIYWDSDKMLKMKGGGVSLARARALDEVSSIASSDHSGKIPLMNNITQRRSSFKASFFGWNNAISEEDFDDNSSFKPEKIVPRVASGKLSSMASSIRPKSMVISTQSKALSKTNKRSSIDYDDYDDDDMYSRKNQLAEQDLKHETVVKEAREIMNSVNNSMVAMGMNAPFRPIEEICPPFQKLHKNLGAQMDALQAVTVRSTKSETSKRQSMKKSKKLRASNFKNRGSMFSMTSGGSSLDNSNRSSNMSILNGTDAMSKFIMSQMAFVQSQQTVDCTSITSNVTPRSIYTSWLPNYMWYQTIAADKSTVMRPTSLCSGTGITGDNQYLNPEMLKVFEMFSTYFVGSKHLFQDGDEDNDGAKMRRSYWMEKIDEIDSDDEMSESSSSSDSEVSDESDMVYELADVGADIDQFVDTEKQIEILQSFINDLRRSQMNDRPMLSIKADASPQSNLSSSTSSDEMV